MGVHTRSTPINMHGNINSLHLESSKIKLCSQKPSGTQQRSLQPTWNSCKPQQIQESCIIQISIALLTSETCRSLQIWHSLQRNKHVISSGIFSTAELSSPEQQKALNEKSIPSAFLDGTKTTSEAETDSVAADRPCAQRSIVLQQKKYQPVWSSEQTHT